MSPRAQLVFYFISYIYVSAICVNLYQYCIYVIYTSSIEVMFLQLSVCHFKITLIVDEF